MIETRLFVLRDAPEEGWACEFNFRGNDDIYRSFLLSDKELLSFAEQIAEFVKKRGLI